MAGIQVVDISVDMSWTLPSCITAMTPTQTVNARTAMKDTSSLVAILKL
ncbi:Uncharacterised protein [Mycobacterium tuberculosis]|nr:Uncharacterised protein [Mycobacterium tuberculosis]